MGWLHSRPKQNKNDKKPKARLEIYPDGDPILSPPIPCAVIVGALHDCGVASSNGMGRVPISWQELKAYSDLSCINLTSWESHQVIMMSRVYCSMVSEATEYRAIKAPYEPELTDDDIYRRGAKASGDAEKALDINSY